MADNVTHLNTHAFDAEPEEKTLLLSNVAIALRMMERALARGAAPGFYLFYGESGWGKTTAATACVLDYEAIYVLATPKMSERALLKELLKQMGEEPKGASNHDYIVQAARALLMSGRPLIVDEADHLLKKDVIETLRAVLDRSQAKIILIGEEDIETKLRSRERVHNRINDFHEAQPASLEDAQIMAEHYCSGVEVAPDLLRDLVIAVNGVTRRIRANLMIVRREALDCGADAIDAAWWEASGRKFMTGKRPVRRKGGHA